jgi:hypothetical protein
MKCSRLSGRGDAIDPNSYQVVWSLDIVDWSQDRVAIYASEEHPKTQSSRKYMVMVGTPYRGDNYVVLQAVVFDGDECVRKQYILKWDPPDSD